MTATRTAAARSAAATTSIAGARKTGRSRHAAERYGRLAEWVAVGLLTLKGYRVLERRRRSKLGEIDIVAVRRRRLAFVEVKARPTIEEAVQAIDTWQALRIGEAAEQWVWRHRAYRDHEIGLDAVFVAPWSLPCHAPNILQHI